MASVRKQLALGKKTKCGDSSDSGRQNRLCELCMDRFLAVRDFFREQVEKATPDDPQVDTELTAMTHDVFNSDSCLSRAYADGQLQLCPVTNLGADDALIAATAESWSKQHPEQANAIFDNLPAVGQALAESAGDEHAARDKLLAQLRGTASTEQQAHRVARTAQIRRAWKQGKAFEDKKRRRGSDGGSFGGSELVACLRELVEQRAEIRNNEAIFMCQFMQKCRNKDKCQACKIERQINEEVFAPLERDRLKRPK